MSTTFVGNNQAILLPTQPSGDHERVLVVRPDSGATVALQYMCGTTFETVKTYSSLTFDRIFIKGIPARLLFTGQSTVELGD